MDKIKHFIKCFLFWYNQLICRHEKWDCDNQIRVIECKRCKKRARIVDYRDIFCTEEHDRIYAVKKPIPASYSTLSYRDIHLKPKKTVKYKEGDHVVIKNDLIKGEYYDGLYFSPSMSEYCGTEQIIIGFNNDDHYRVSDLPWVFNDDMIAYSVYNSVQPIHSELSKLEIAAMAMQGMLACPNRDLRYDSIDKFISECYEYADALIKECNGTKVEDKR